MYKALIRSMRSSKDAGREETLKEVLRWLEEITNDGDDGCGSSMVYFTPFDYKEQMLQSFKEQFNI